MRIVQPDYASKELARRRQQKRRKQRAMAFFGVLIGGAMVIAAVVFLRQEPTPSEAPISAISNLNSTNDEAAMPANDPVLKTFSGPEFKALYNSFSYPFTEQLESPPTITSDPTADARIQALAASRGYTLRSTPMADQLVTLIGDFPVQKLVAEPLTQLLSQLNQQAAPLSVTSAYRSIEDQQTLFSNRLAAQGVSLVSTSYIAEGLADDAINTVLETTAPPGYSRHHTGYTIDFQCGSMGLADFAASPCYAILSSDNFKIAKELGFIPSYPEGTDLQGPEPESWEYIWVGRDALYQ